MLQLAPLFFLIIVVPLVVLLRRKSSKDDSSSSKAKGNKESGDGANPLEMGQEEPSASSKEQGHKHISFEGDSDHESLGGPQQQISQSEYNLEIEDTNVFNREKVREEHKKEEKLRKQIDSRSSAMHFICISLVIIIFVLYPTLCEWSFNLLRCEDIDYSYVDANRTTVSDVRSVFFHDRVRLCSSSEHRRYAFVGLIMGLIWGFGTPLCCLVMFLVLKAKMSRVIASRMLTFLVAGYKRHVWWWECLMLLRKLSLIVLVVFVRSPRLQILAAFWILALHLVIHIAVAPYEYPQADRLEQWSLFVLCGTLNLALLYEWVSVEDENLTVQITGWVLTGIIFLLNVAVTLWMAAWVVYEFFREAKRFIRHNDEWIEEKFPKCLSGCLIQWAFASVQEETEKLAPMLAPNVNELRQSVKRNALVIDEDTGSDWSENSTSDDEEEQVEEFRLSDGFAVSGQPTAAKGNIFSVAPQRSKTPGSDVNDIRVEEEEMPSEAIQVENTKPPGETDTPMDRSSQDFRLSQSNSPKASDGRMQFVVQTLKATIASLRANNSDLAARHGEALAKIDALEAQVTNLSKQLEIANEYCKKSDENLKIQLDALAALQQTLQTLEKENQLLKQEVKNAEALRRVNDELNEEREALRHDLRQTQANKTAAELASEVNTWQRKAELSQRERDEQMKFLLQQAKARKERIDEFQAEQQKEQERLIEEQVENKRKQRELLAARRPHTSGPTLDLKVRSPRESYMSSNGDLTKSASFHSPRKLERTQSYATQMRDGPLVVHLKKSQKKLHFRGRDPRRWRSDSPGSDDS